MDCDDIPVLNAKIVADYAVHTCRAIIKIIIGQNDEHCILSLLAFD